ncbi:protein MAINTENANCE OF MERISTEMS-like [Papaver somniferum]|uniref:protein MAINTENANCE OF MERISTEMS-like n=1 Tax=Papaver somniferum TaxID=3469 RepID=UPI000E6FD958|nr:protein MAINTENANCE OF MERISTEMS-like [Papaver somniferum]
MTITPNNVKFITGLSIEGKAVKHEYYVQELNWDNIYAFTKNVFQRDEDRTKSGMLVGKAKQRIFHLSKFRHNFMGRKNLRDEGKEVTPERIISTANAYVLYVLGVVIFPDISGAHVSANFIQLLQPFDKIHEYSWGTAILVSLNELRKAFRARRNHIGRNMDFLQAWIYMHFPIFSQRDFENKEWGHEYYGHKYAYKSKLKNQKKGYLKLRRQLDNLIMKYVFFDPYKEDLAKRKRKGKKIGCREKKKPSRVLDNPSKATNQGREKC